MILRPLDQLQAGAHRHLDVAEEDGDLVLAHQVDRLAVAPGGQHLVEFEPGPVDTIQNPLNGEDFIVHDQQFHLVPLHLAVCPG